MAWLQLKISTSKSHVDAFEDELLNQGAMCVTLSDNADQPILEPALGETPLWNETQITGLFDADIDTQQISKNLEPLQNKTQCTLRWEQLEDKDWIRAWMDEFKPIQCGKSLWICPSWCEPPEPNAVNLKLDPGLAFGTGTHPTTFLCLQWLDQIECQGKTAIDFGCGSGILAIAALLLGAKSVQGIDIDPQALIASKDNCEKNGLAADTFPVYLPQEFKSDAVDIMLANILAGPLVELADEISSHLKPGGLICLSGILATQAEVVMNAYTDIEFDKPEQKEDWVRLTGKKRS
ncbi:50S ribosomal protein L11 methyltransferase [Sessilibacter corallicola]|uniref:Ribosomal protein L11 methyltransferase n=1 Tax=Sessilibacter corallicola TaxID=2904075 RepID=A0ABQ0AAR2_9GAMM